MNKLLKVVLYGLGATLLCAAVTLPVAWMILRGSLPQLDGVQPATVLSAVDLERDSVGVVTVRAASDEDLAFGLGYAHAQDRFFSMDLLRRSSTGELSELIGPATIEHDTLRRKLGIRPHLGRVFANLSAEEKASLQAYSKGVNAGLESLKTRPFPYLLLRAQPRRWEPLDSLAVGMAMYFDLQDPLGKSQINQLQALDHISENVANFLFENGRHGSRPLNDRPLPILPPPSDGWPTAKVASQLNLLEDVSVFGSNAFAVNSSLTHDKRAILAVDMHLSLRVPNLWYRARLQLAGAFDAVGASLPGLPGLIVGTNGKIAWGFTNSYVDTLDLIHWDSEADKKDPLSVTDLIRIRGQDPLEVEFNSWEGLPLLEINGSNWLVQWTGTNDAYLNLGIFGLMYARDMETALKISHEAGLPCQNIVIADDKGHIAWTLIGGLPMRSQPAPGLPLSINDNWRWSGRLPPGQTPRWINPTNGRIWTANNRIMGQAHVDLLGSAGYSQQGRDTVIAEALFSSSQFNEADLLDIQYSSQTRIYDRWRSLLQELTSSEQWRPPIDLDPDLWREILEGDGKADPASRGYLFLRTFHRFLADAVFSTLLGNLDTPWQGLGLRWDEPLFQIVSTPSGKQLDPEQTNWMKTFDRAFEATAKRLTEQFGNLTQATWGKRNQLKIQHPLSLALPILSTFLDMPSETVAGDGYSPRAQAPAFGASQRLVVSPNHLDDAIFHMPTGQSGHFLSPFYANGHDDWVNGTPSPLLPGKSVHLLQLIPEKGVKRKL